MTSTRTFDLMHQAAVEEFARVPGDPRKGPTSEQLCREWIELNGYRKGNGELWRVQRIPPALYAKVWGKATANQRSVTAGPQKLMLYWPGLGEIEIVPDEEA